MTLGQIIRSTVAAHGSRVAFMTIGKNSISWTYDELYDRVRRYAAVLQNQGLQRGDRVGLVSENCPEWALVDWACQIMGYVPVPIYPSLPQDQTEYILRDSGAKLGIGGAEDQLKKVQCTAGLPSLLLKGPGSLDEAAAVARFDPEKMDAEIDAGDPEDPFTIIYTSGTTGTPKGAVMPNRAFVHVVTSVKGPLPVDENDRFLCFLPMSHVYERVGGQCLPVFLGATICFSKGLASLATEMREFKPTIMLCVPRFLENLRDRVIDGIAKEKPIKQKLFALALSQGTRRARGEFAPLFPLLDKLVGSKVRERTGGNLRFFVSGGAALAPAVAEFYMSMGFTVLQGYGLTETSGGTFLNRIDNNKYWTVGEPIDMDVELAEDGEILIRGKGLMLGYHNLPKETSEAIDPEGWFHTGDIGEFEGRSLKITDRKKDLLVLANGKNIAPQKLENQFKTSEYIQEAVVLGDGMDSCVALIIPNFDAVRRALNLGDDVVLSRNPEACALIKKEVDRINKTQAVFEMVKRHALLDQSFSIEGGELTPTLKVKRKVVEKMYATEIAALHKQ